MSSPELEANLVESRNTKIAVRSTCDWRNK